MRHFDGANDFLDVAETYLTHIHTAGVRANVLYGAAFRINTPHGKVGRRLFGVIESGDYGDELNIVSIGTNTQKYKKAVDDAVMRPFYYSFYVTSNRDVTIVLLQRFKQFGIQGLFIGDFNNWFEANYNGYEIVFGYVVASDLINNVIDRGEVKSINFYRYGIPTEISDEYDEGVNEVPGTMEVTFKAHGGGLPIKNKLKRLISGNDPVPLESAFIFEGLIEDFEYQGVKFVLQDGSKQRTINLNNLDAFRADYSLDEYVPTVNTIPVFEKLNDYASDLTGDLLINIGAVAAEDIRNEPN